MTIAKLNRCHPLKKFYEGTDLRTRAAKHLKKAEPKKNLLHSGIISGILCFENMRSTKPTNTDHAMDWNKVPNDIHYCLLDYLQTDIHSYLSLRLINHDWNEKITNDCLYKQIIIHRHCLPKSLLSFRYGSTKSLFFEFGTIMSNRIPKTKLKQLEEELKCDGRTSYERTTCGFIGFDTCPVNQTNRIYGQSLFKKIGNLMYPLNSSASGDVVVSNTQFLSLKNQSNTDALVVKSLDGVLPDNDPLISLLLDQKFTSTLTSSLFSKFCFKKFFDNHSVPSWTRNLETLIQYVCYYGNILLTNESVMNLMVVMMKNCRWSGSFGNFLMRGGKTMESYHNMLYQLCFSPVHVVVENGGVNTYMPLQSGHPYFETFFQWKYRLLYKYFVDFHHHHQILLDHDLCLNYRHVKKHFGKCAGSESIFRPTKTSDRLFVPMMVYKIWMINWELNNADSTTVSMQAENYFKETMKTNYSLLMEMKSGDVDLMNYTNKPSPELSLKELIDNTDFCLINTRYEFSIMVDYLSKTTDSCSWIYQTLPKLTDNQFDVVVYYDAEILRYQKTNIDTPRAIKLIEKNPCVYTMLDKNQQSDEQIIHFVLQQEPKMLGLFPDHLRKPNTKNIGWVEKYGCSISDFKILERVDAIPLIEKYPVLFFASFPNYCNDIVIVKMLETRGLWVPKGMLSERVINNYYKDDYLLKG
jgi:hypothetical protein